MQQHQRRRVGRATFAPVQAHTRSKFHVAFDWVFDRTFDRTFIRVFDRSFYRAFDSAIDVHFTSANDRPGHSTTTNKPSSSSTMKGTTALQHSPKLALKATAATIKFSPIGGVR